MTIKQTLFQRCGAFWRIASLSVLMGLTACGGGGGGGGTATLSSLALFAGNLGGTGNTDGVGVSARFDDPQSVATDSAGNVYVADTLNSTIRKITPVGVVTTFAGTAGAAGSTDGTGAAARFYFPRGLATDGANNVYVADTFNSTIRKITPAGVVTTFAGTAGATGSTDGIGSTARFSFPYSVAVDSLGNIYVADNVNHTIRKITSTGVVSTLAGMAGTFGSTDDTGAAARFYFPQGVAADSAGNVYVADTNNDTIRKITPVGVVSTLAGTAGSFGSTDGIGTAARFYSPQSIVPDNAGNFYVADSFNHTIRKITSAGVVSTVVGVAGQVGFVADALPGVLGSPQAVAVHGTTLYITIRHGVAVVTNLP